MPWHFLKTLWRNLARKQAVESDLAEEIRSYQGLLEDQKARAGADPRQARREALLELGGAEQIKDNVRDVRLGATLTEIAAELRQSLRGLRRNPGLTILGTIMLAVGMSASTIMFSIFYAALVQPMPFRDVDRLVQIWETRMSRGIDHASFTEANFWDVHNRSRSLEQVAGHHYGESNLTGAGPAEKVRNSGVTANFFRTLGVSPVLGRDFSADDDHGGSNNDVAILGYRFWHTRFGGDPNILGKTLRLNGRAFTVVGVLPPGEPWIDEEIYTLFGYRADANRGSWEYEVVGRLAPGATLPAARADLQQVAASLQQAYPQEDKGIGFSVGSSTDWGASPTTRSALWVLMGAVTFLLFIACLNMTNLLLARGTARQREIAVRTALGAGSARLVRFVMMESLLLSGFGAALGLGMAYAALRVIQTLEIRGLPRLTDVGLNPWVVGFAVGIALLTGVLAGLAPAWQAPVSRIASALRDGERQTGSRSQGRLRNALVTGEVALSFLLLVGSGLLIRSFGELMSVNRGFRTENRLVFNVSMPGSYYKNGVGKQFLDRFLAQLSTLPEVVAVGAVSNRPLGSGNPGMGVAAAGDSGPGNPPWASWRIVSPGYFRAVGLPLLRGRNFDESDRPVWAERGQPPLLQRHVILSEGLARQILPNQDPIGRHVSLWKGQSELDADVVGVVADSRERGLASDPTKTVYLPYGRIALTGEFVVHTRGNPLAITATVRQMLASLDPNLPMADVRSFEEVVSRSVAPQRFNTIVLGVFSGFALLLAMTGLYGVLSYSMSRRTSEIGLRVALGASGRNIVGMTIGQGMRPALVGILLGALGAWWLSRYLTTLLFGVKPFDLVTYVAVAALLLATGLLACYLPGRRAMRTDPAIALRTE